MKDAQPTMPVTNHSKLTQSMQLPNIKTSKLLAELLLAKLPKARNQRPILEADKIRLYDSASEVADMKHIGTNLEPTADILAADALVEQHYQQLVADYKRHREKHGTTATTDELAVIDKAFRLAKQLHSGMMRKSGEPYIIHPIRVAQITINEIGLDAHSVVAALMHDTVEDTEITLEEIKKELGSEIAVIVDGLTKIRSVFKGKDRSIALEKAENVRKILFTMGKEIRVILIKIADRLDNMRTMDAMRPDKQEIIASETIYLYAPIAHRLGLYAIKSELEDLCLKYTEREAYTQIKEHLNQKKKEREAYIKAFIEPVTELLKLSGIPRENYRIFGRPKHIYSIWQKMQRNNLSFNKIFDLFAIRIVLNDPPEGIIGEHKLCYHVFAAITDTNNGGYPNNHPERIRDLLGKPKSNGYESLHVTVTGPQGKFVEVQIRTERMDAIAERGVAAHFLYKQDKVSYGGFDEWLDNVREQLQNLRDGNPIEVLLEMQQNLYEKEILVITPKGEVKTLRENATVLDFAFAIHTGLGCTCMGGEINGKLYPISHKLKNGDQVKIIASKKVKPTKEWLNIAVTSKARSKIKSYVMNELDAAKQALAQTGREMLERKAKSLKVKMSSDDLTKLIVYFKYTDSIGFFCAIASKEFDLLQLKDVPLKGDRFDFSSPQIQRTSNPKGEPQQHQSQQQRPEQAEQRHINLDSLRQTDDNDQDYTDVTTILGGFANRIDYSIAKCCSPAPGDKVFGLISIGQGIRIHRSDCPNATDIKEKYGYRIVPLKWPKQQQEVLYLVGLRIIGYDELGIVSKISKVVSDTLEMNMTALAFDTDDAIFNGRIKVYVKNESEVKKLMQHIKAIPAVHTVSKM